MTLCARDFYACSVVRLVVLSALGLGGAIGGVLGLAYALA